MLDNDVAIFTTREDPLWKIGERQVKLITKRLLPPGQVRVQHQEGE